MSWSRRAILGGLGASSLAGCSGLGSDHVPPEVPSELSVALPAFLRGRVERGPRLYFLEDRSVPLVAMAIAVHRGFRDDPAQKEGLASVASRLLLEGMEGGDRVALLERYGEQGTTPRVEVSPSRVVLSCLVQRQYAASALRLMAENLRAPTVSEPAFARVRREHKDALAVARGAPEAVAGMGLVLGTLGIDPPSAAVSVGTATGLDALEYDDVGRWLSHSMRPDDMSVLLSGDLSPEDALQWAGDAVRGWPLDGSAVPAPTPAVEAVPGRPRVVLIRWPAAPKALIAVGGLRQPVGHPREPAQGFADAIMGGALHFQLRTHQRTSYGVRVKNWSTVGGPVNQLWAKLDLASLGRSVQVLWRFLTKLEQQTVEISPQQLENIRTASIAEMLNGYQGASAGLSVLIRVASQDLGPEAPGDRLAALRRIDVEEVSLELLRLYHPDRIQLCVVGDDDAIAKARQVLPAEGGTVRRRIELFGEQV